MKILQVIHDFLPHHNAGSEIYTYNLSRELAKRHDVTVFCTECVPDKPQYELMEREFGGLRILEAVHNQAFETFERTYEDPEMDRLFRRILEREKPDVVHIQHLQYHSINYVREAHRRDIPVLYTLHEYCLACPRKGLMLREDLSLCPEVVVDRCADCVANDSMAPVVIGRTRARFDERMKALVPARLRRMVTKRLVKYGFMKPPGPAQPAGRDFASEIRVRRDAVLDRCAEVDRFIAPSRFLRSQFVKFGIDPDRIVFSDYGFVDEGYREIERTKSDKVRFGFVGTLVEFKGAHLIVDAFHRLPENAAAELRIYGDLGTFPPYTQRLEKLAVRESCRLMGRFENHRVAEILADLDVLIVPSLWFENSPLTIHEAFLAGIPVITTDLGGMADLVEDDKNGLRFERGNPEDLAEKMRRLIEDPELLARLAPTGDEVKAIEDDARDHERWYAELIEARRGAGTGAGTGVGGGGA